MVYFVKRSVDNMPRTRRILSNTRLYHVTFRGINKQDIFLEESDYQKFLDILTNKKKIMKFRIYAYCLMTNHAHLLIEEKNLGDISVILKRCLISYVQYFNKKYERCGKLITDRYFSNPIEFDKYLFNVIRYIHQNPIEVGFELNYKWSSFREYKKNISVITDTYIILNTFDHKSFCKFHEEIETNKFEPNNQLKKSDKELIQYCKQNWNLEPIQLKTLPEQKIQQIIIDLIYKNNFSMRQLTRSTQISKYHIKKYLGQISQNGNVPDGK